jgi:hypothetical protein
MLPGMPALFDTYLRLRHDGAQVRTELTKPGQFAINPRGTWHTADVHAESLMLFITAGEGTQTRPR